MQHGLGHGGVLQPRADQALALLHQGGHGANVVPENGRFQAGILFQLVHIGFAGQGNADAHGARHLAVTHQGRAGAQGERHHRAGHHAHHGFSMAARAHGFLIVDVVAVFRGMAPGHHHALLIGDGDEFRSRHFHQLFADGGGSGVIAPRHGLDQFGVLGDQPGFFQKFFAVGIVGGVRGRFGQLRRTLNAGVQGRFQKAHGRQKDCRAGQGHGHDHKCDDLSRD